MRLSEAEQIIAANCEKKVFLVHGKDVYGLHRVVEMLKARLLIPGDASVLQVYETDPPVDEFLAAVQSLPFFSDQNVIVLNDCKLFKSKPGETDEPLTAKKPVYDWENVLQSLPEFNRVIIVCRDVADKRRKIFKNIAKTGCVIEVESLNARSAREYFEAELRDRKYRLDNQAAAMLQAAFDNAAEISFGMLDSELEKLLLYKGADSLITVADLENVFSASFNLSVFKFCDALSERKPALALQLLDKLLNGGEPLIKLLGLCVRQYRLLAVTKELSGHGSSADVVARLKIQPFVATKLLRDVKNYTLAELRSAICALATLDAGLKNGQANTATAHAVFVRILTGDAEKALA